MKKIISLLLTLALILSVLCSCEIDNRFVEVTEKENENEGVTGWDDVDDDNISGWDDVITSTWEEVDDLSRWVQVQVLFDDIAEGYTDVECIVLDYQSNGKYFDGEKVYELVGNKFDLNPLIAKFAIGPGVIVICVVVNVATAGTATPVACFFAGAAQAAISEAIKGAAFGAAMGAVSAAIKSEGELDSTFYGTLEGASEGYMWGAIFGSITGGWSSKYCFVEGTPVLTDAGMCPIDDIVVGDKVCSYDEQANAFVYSEVSNVIVGSATETVKIWVGDDMLESTPNHPYFTTDRGWVKASELTVGQCILSEDGAAKEITKIDNLQYEVGVSTYNLTVANSHTYVVGTERLVTHNVCRNNRNYEYAGKTYYFDEGSDLARKYPNGVAFSDDAFPRFEPYAKKTLVFDVGQLNGNYNHDFALANKLAGFGNTAASTPAGYTWHHVEDCRTMLLVPKDIHNVSRGYNGVAHTGGASKLKELAKTAAAGG